jgi:RND family efflux transporter MFP subunit
LLFSQQFGGEYRMREDRNRWNIAALVSFLAGMVLTAGGVTLADRGFAGYHLVLTSQQVPRKVLLNSQKPPPKVALPPRVQTVIAKVQPFDEVIGASGRIEPSALVNVTSAVVAKVLRVPVDRGSVVHPGDPLVELDPRLYEANLASARASYAHAHQQLARMQTLAHENFAALADVETAQVADAQAYYALVSAEIDLDNTTVRSTVTAVVTSCRVNSGETSRTDQVLMQLGVLDPVVMKAAVAEDKIDSLYVGMPAEVSLDHFADKVFAGLVTKVDSEVNPATHTIYAYIRLDNHDLSLPREAAGYARLLSHRIVLAAPSTSIMYPNGDRATVFVVDKMKRAHVRPVLVGLSSGGFTEILSGLDEGEPVVVAGQFNLNDNQVVRIAQDAPRSKS